MVNLQNELQVCKSSRNLLQAQQKSKSHNHWPKFPSSAYYWNVYVSGGSAGSPSCTIFSGYDSEVLNYPQKKFSREIFIKNRNMWLFP